MTKTILYLYFTKQFIIFASFFMNILQQQLKKIKKVLRNFERVFELYIFVLF